MCYREVSEPLDFTGLSIACLSGENGAGKSTLLDALTWALWGKARLSSDDDLIALGASDMEVHLDFALDGQEYQIIRKRNKGKRTGQTELYFHIRNGEGWRTLGSAGVRETQDTISTTLRMNYETFTNSAFLRQNHADEFTRKKPAERKGVLAEILGLSVYEDLEARAKERARSLDGQIRGLDGKIEAYDREAQLRDVRRQLVTEAEERVAACEIEVAQAETVLTDTSRQVQQLEALRPLRAERAAQIERSRAEHNELTYEIETRRRALDQMMRLLDRQDEIRAGVAALRGAQAEVERLERLRAGYDLLVERRRGYAQALYDAERDLRARLLVAEGELRGLSERAARRPGLEGEIARLSERLDRLTPITQELETARDRRNVLQEQIRSAHKLQLERAELQKRIDTRHDSLVATREEWKRQVKDFAERLKPVERWRAERERAATERAHLEREAPRVETLRADESGLTERAGALRAERESIKARGDEINRKLSLLQQDGNNCPLCGNELGHDGLAHIEHEYARERRSLREQYSSAGRDITTIEARLTDLRAEIQAVERRTGTLPEIAGRIAQLDTDLRTAEELRQKQSTVQRDLSTLELQLLKGDYEREARADLARVEAALKGIGDPDALEREDRRLDERIRRLEQQIGEHATVQADLDTRRRELLAIDAEAPALAEATARVAAIGRDLEQQDFAPDVRVALAQIDLEIGALGYSRDRFDAARAATQELMHWAEEARQIERAEEQLGHDRQALARDQDLLRRREEELQTQTRALEQLDQQLRALAPAQQRRDEAAAALREKRRELHVHQNDLSEKRALLNRADEAAVDLLACQNERLVIQRRKGLFEELTVAFGKKGIQALLIETAIPEIEHEANQLLAHMTDNQMHLTFETQGATKKGDPTETLDIKIADALGTRDYDAYSGGESFRVDFAIRIALAKLLARRAGARLETLVIDEGFGSQDARGRERLVEAITAVQRDFKQILVVTHIQELKDMFPAFIEVTKTPRGSAWTIG
jgi:exonuclease SbcC